MASQNAYALSFRAGYLRFEVFSSEREGPDRHYFGGRRFQPCGFQLISNSKLVLTDSGGIQEETTVYQVPCITLRENTERPITITEGTNELAGSDTDKILKFAQAILNGEWKKGSIPNLWDGETSKRIVKAIQA